MSSASVKPVRQPITVGAESRRRLGEWLAVRYPRSIVFVLGRLMRLSPGAGLRKGLLRRAFRHGIEALNRGDYEAAFALWGADCEFVPSEMGALGLRGTRGRDERIRFQRRWVSEWGRFRFEPEEIVDLGDGRRLMWVGRTSGAGLSSGAAVGSECAVLLTLSDGWVVREEVFLDVAKAYEAAGLTA